MRATLLVAVLLALGLAGCQAGREARTVTRTVTRTQTQQATAPLTRDHAYQLAFDFCSNAPLDLVSLFQGGSPEDVARGFSQQIRPSLRHAALQGCLAALHQR